MVTKGFQNFKMTTKKKKHLSRQVDEVQVALCEELNQI